MILALLLFAVIGLAVISGGSKIGGTGGVVLDLVRSNAARYDIDGRFLFALWLTEQGPQVLYPDGTRGPGFGVLNVGADTIEAQASWAAGTISKTLARFRQELGVDPGSPYSEDFIRYFSWGVLPDGSQAELYPGYAKVGAANDPRGLNRNHYPNLVRFYDSSETAIV